MLAVAFALGCVAGLSGFVFGMPGSGLFVPVMWLAGFVALLVAPGWPGFAALLSGAIITAAVLDLSDGVSGLLLLIVVVVAALTAHGALCAFVLRRLRTVGLLPGLRDAQVLAGGGLAIGLVLVFVWIADPVKVARGVARLPRRHLSAAGWAHMEPTGLGVGSVHSGDLDEMEAKRQRRRETWRRADNEEPPSDPN